MGESIKLKAQDGHELGAYRAEPVGEAKGAIVVVQEIFGVNQHIRNVADGYAALGYVAIAPALFDRYERGVELTYEGADMQRAYGLYGKLDPKTALLDVAAAFTEAEQLGKGAAVIGFCYGGFMSWLSATRGKALGMVPRCTVGYYAGGIGQVATEQPSCPVLLHFGGKDTHIGMDQVDAVRTAHPEVEIYMYDDAEHGFNCDMRASFNAAASKLAGERTEAFLTKYLG